MKMYTEQQAKNAGYSSNFAFCSDKEFTKGTYTDVIDTIRKLDNGDKLWTVTEKAMYNPETKKMSLTIIKVNKLIKKNAI